MTTPRQRETHEAWLLELTAIPTAAGHEDRVIQWIEQWVARRKNLALRFDDAGNLIIRQKRSSSAPPIYITAHLDHPAFVVRRVLEDKLIELEFRGGVHDPYFEKAGIEIFDADDTAHAATIVSLDSTAKPFKIVTARLRKQSDRLQVGDIGRWLFKGDEDDSSIAEGLLHAPACDDLAGAAAALAAMDLLRSRKDCEHVGLLLTRAEEVGFLGTLAVCRDTSIERNARLICLENSRSFPESPIGGGPIVRVGDRLSVFDPRLTNAISDVISAYAKRKKNFAWQRKLMPGGACEATAFSTFGYEATCVCLPLGNYHNMRDIDGVLAGTKKARIERECIAVSDYHGLIELLVVCCQKLDTQPPNVVRDRLSKLLKDRAFVLAEQ